MMEISGQSLSYAHANLPKPLLFSTSPSPNFYHSRFSVLAHQHHGILYFKKNIPIRFQLQDIKIKAGKQRRFGPATVKASEAASPTSGVSERWLLEPVGDGNSRHIGYKVPMPDAFEIASSSVTVGRLAEKADMVIPVATVSGVHALLQNKDGSLLVTDLDSTNGTFIDEQRLRSGDVARVPPGSRITFGDIHLAMFRVSKIEKAENTSSEGEPEAKVETDSPPANTN
ncbi:Forkhead-associated (FHA) domain [Dillenia turbinata]|uniref:Forkhead-associated (FHA) domain n=1 Tax=Dillenia turbinata TaxID=194707 RepID=A0AAN8Z695_9MAGN